MTPQPGEFWVAEIPFTQGMNSKKRPVLVLWLDGRDAVVAAVTSAGPRSVTDLPLVAWKSSGLRITSTDPIGQGYVLCTASGADALISIDPDAAGPAAPRPMILIKNQGCAVLAASNFVF